MKLIKLYLMLSCLALCNAQLFAHYHNLIGNVNTERGDALIGATIYVEHTALGAKSDNTGNFEIKNIPNGRHNIMISYVGYRTKSININIDPNDSTDINIGTIALAISESMANEVVVTATRTEKVYEDVPVKISVLSDKIFEKTNSLSLKEGLSFQPGLRIENNCQTCGFSQIRLNGLEGKYSQILIDGHSIFSALNGVYGLDQIPANMIDRIEIIRGGGSALYGGNAIAGVVNIITKTPTENMFSANVNNSFIDMKIPDRNVQLNASMVNLDQNLGISLFSNDQRRREWDANGDGYSEIGRLDVKTFGANLFYKPNYLSKITFGYYSIYHEIRGGDSIDLAPHQSNVCQSVNHNTNVYQLQYEQYIGGTSDKFAVYAAMQDTKRRSYYGAHKDPNAYGYTKNYTISGGVQYNHIVDKLLGTHILTGGYEFNKDHISDNILSYKKTIDQTSETHGFYIQDDWEIGRELDLVIGARVDKNNFIDNPVFIPRAGLLYKPLDDLSLRGSISTGYRAPQTFDEDLHIDLIAGEAHIIKNLPNLKPEYSTSYSFSADYVLHIGNFPISMSAEFFNTKITDAFALENSGIEENGSIIILRKNANSATVMGGTIEIGTIISKKIDIKAGYTIQSSKYSESIIWSEGDEEAQIPAQASDKILRTPNRYGYFTLISDITENLNIAISGIITGEMYVPHYKGGITENGGELERDVLVTSNSFFEMNAKASYKFVSNPDIELYIGIQNIFSSFQKDFDRGADRDSDYIYGPIRPRSIYAGIKLKV